MSKYFNPYTDFGFKKLFGEENNKDLLQNFLNAILDFIYDDNALIHKFRRDVALRDQEGGIVF